MLSIIAVDDSEVNLAIYKQALKKIGNCTYKPFSSSLDALAWCAEHEPDLVLCDYWMPAPNGGPSTTRLRS